MAHSHTIVLIVRAPSYPYVMLPPAVDVKTWCSPACTTANNSRRNDIKFICEPSLEISHGFTARYYVGASGEAKFFAKAFQFQPSECGDKLQLLC